MPTSVCKLLAHVGLDRINYVQWGERIKSEEEGVYIVSLSPDPSKNDFILKQSPISLTIVEEWLYLVGGFELDGQRTFDVIAVIERMNSFWLPDENILYIGKAPKRKNNKGIGNRIKEYYQTGYSEVRPHAGGHWLKTLKCMNELYVYYAETLNCGTVEIEMLEYFCKNISDNTLAKCRDKNLPLPFANLELKKGKRKNHGLYKMKKNETKKETFPRRCKKRTLLHLNPIASPADGK